MNPLGEVYVRPFFTEKECDNIVHSACDGNSWGTNRHSNYPTTDIPLSNLKLNLTSKIDQLSVMCMDLYGLQGIAKPFDVFVVKYEVGKQDSLDTHRDASELSFVALLSDDFDGGGTYYEGKDHVVSLRKGEVAFHCGKLRHGGQKVTRGTRYVLIGFFDVFSPSIRKENGDEKLSSSVSDRRYLQYLYKHKPTRNYRVHIRVINLLKRRDKLVNILKRIQKIDTPTGWSVDVQVVPADEGLKCRAYTDWVCTDDKTNEYWKRPITSGEIGCFVSHMKIVQNTTLDTDELLLVLEDDACFYSDLLYRIDELLSTHPNADALDMGGVLFSPGVYYQTHCFLWKHTVSLKSLVYDDRVIPFDEFTSVLAGRYPRSDILRLWSDAPVLNIVHDKFSWQGGVTHDTQTCDDYDFINYYKFDVQMHFNPFRLLQTANQRMWTLELNKCQPGICHDGFKIHMTSKVTLVGVLLWKPTSVLTFQHNDSVLRNNMFVVFPSYLCVNIQDCQIYYGCK